MSNLSWDLIKFCGLLRVYELYRIRMLLSSQKVNSRPKLNRNICMKSGVGWPEIMNRWQSYSILNNTSVISYKFINKFVPKCQCYYTLSDQSIPLVTVTSVVSLLTEQLWIDVILWYFLIQILINLRTGEGHCPNQETGVMNCGPLELGA